MEQARMDGVMIAHRFLVPPLSNLGQHLQDDSSSPSMPMEAETSHRQAEILLQEAMAMTAAVATMETAAVAIMGMEIAGTKVIMVGSVSN
jgi:hypothetical protein